MADETAEWVTRASSIDYECPGFEVRKDDVTLPDGTETDYHYVDESPAVVILPFLDSEGTGTREVVTIREWRQAVGRTNRGLPAGSIEGDEDVLVAAQRELHEETGYEADRLEPLLTVEPTNGITNSVHHHFVAYGCQRADEQSLDFNETIDVRTEPYDELLADVVDDRIRDGRTATAVLQYELTHR